MQQPQSERQGSQGPQNQPRGKPTAPRQVKSKVELGLTQPDAERELIGMLLDDASMPEHLRQDLLVEAMTTDLRPTDLDTDLYRAVLETMLRLYEEGSSYDLAMVDAALRGKEHDLTALWGTVNELVRAGSKKRLHELIHLVCEASARRQALTYNAELAQLAIDQSISPADVAARAIARYRELESRAAREETLSEIVERYRAQLDQWQRTPGELRGTTTGFRKLNKLTRGLRRGHVTIVAARTSVGKTSLLLATALNSARNCRAGHQVGIVSLEMQKEDLVHRFITMMSGVESDAIESGMLTPEQRERVDQAMEGFAVLPLRIIDAGTAVRRTNGARGVLTPSEIRRRMLVWRREGPLDLVGLDYVQLVRSEPENAKLPRDERLNEIMQALHDIAVELQTPMMILSQLSRETEKRVNHLPTMADLSESSGIERVADAVWLLYRADYYKERGVEVPTEVDRPDGVVDVIVAKNRNGSVGKTQLYFDRTTQRYGDYDPFTAI